MEQRKNDEVQMVELYKVEMERVHAAKSRRAAVIICILATIAVLASIIGNIVIVDIFTSKYNSRTKDWLDTMQVLVDRINGPGVDNESTINVQQFPPG